MRVVLWALSLTLTGGSFSANSSTAAITHPAGEKPLRILWLSPHQLPAVRRAYLTRLLTRAVEGRPIRGEGVRDSRPQLRTIDLTALRATSSGPSGGRSPNLPPE